MIPRNDNSSIWKIVATVGCAVPVASLIYSKLDVWRRNLFKDPREPIFVSYSIPFLGNAIEFGTDMEGFLERHRRMLPKEEPIFSSLITGKIMHFVTDPSIVPQIYRTRQVNFRRTLGKFVELGFGCSTELFDQLFVHENARFPDFKMILMKQLLNSSELNEITSKAQVVLKELLLGRSTTKEKEWKTYDLMELVSDLIFKASVSAAISPVLATTENLRHLEVFDGLTPPVFSEIVSMEQIPAGYKAREAIYQQLKSDEFIATKSKLVREMETMLSTSIDGGVTRDDQDRIILFLMWASTANSMPTVFWMMYYLLKDRAAWGAIRKEVVTIHSTKQDPNKPFSNDELDSMVGLQSAFQETLRMASSLRVMRDVTEDFVLDLKSSRLPNQYLLKQGSILVGYTPMLHKDSEVFGNPHQFQWDRFLPQNSKNFTKNGKLLSEPMRAFGGGAHLCPGRKFIANEVKALVANLVTSCDVRLSNPRTTANLDPWRQGAGIPQPDQPINVQLRPRSP